MITLETERLILRPWRADDIGTLADIYADPEVMRYIRTGAVLDRAETEEQYHGMVEHWRAHGFGLFAVERRDGGDLLGWAGLAMPYFLPEVLPAPEIGWRLRRDSWGHGFATEAATAALRFALDDRGLDRIVSIRHPENHRSRRVMEKIGLTHEFDTVVPGIGQPVAVHACTASSRILPNPG